MVVLAQKIPVLGRKRPTRYVTIYGGVGHMITSIKKRDGRIVPFDQEKIEQAISVDGGMGM